VDADFQAIRDAVDGVKLSADQKHVVTWCLAQLPKLYREFSQTYEVRVKQQIAQLVQQVLHQLASAPDARAVAEAMTVRLCAMHERLGIPGPDFKPLPPPAKKSRQREAS
jgi:hypothetical protein